MSCPGYVLVLSTQLFPTIASRAQVGFFSFISCGIEVLHVLLQQIPFMGSACDFFVLASARHEMMALKIH